MFRVLVASFLMTGVLALAAPVLAQGQPPGLRYYALQTPCRIVDTRNAIPARRVADKEVFSFVVATANTPGAPGLSLTSQGGSPAGCGVPIGAKAAFLNIVAVLPSTAGNLRGWPFATPQPFSSIINFANIFESSVGAPGEGLSIANGLPLPLCNISVSACPYDINILNEMSSPTGTLDIVVDVLGYYLP